MRMLAGRLVGAIPLGTLTVAGPGRAEAAEINLMAPGVRPKFAAAGLDYKE